MRMPMHSAGLYRFSASALSPLIFQPALIASSSEDVLMQRFGFVLHLLETILDDVAYRYEAGQPPPLHDRQMSELAGRHPFHDLGDRVRFAAGHDLARHHLTNRLLERRRAAFGQPPHDIALGQYADDLAVGPGDDHRPDLMRGERLCCTRDRYGLMDGTDVGAFVAHSGFLGHGLPPFLRTPHAPTRLIVRRP